jgi:hypothetical protein
VSPAAWQASTGEEKYILPLSISQGAIARHYLKIEMLWRSKNKEQSWLREPEDTLSVSGWETAISGVMKRGWVSHGPTEKCKHGRAQAVMGTVVSVSCLHPLWKDSSPIS